MKTDHETVVRFACRAIQEASDATIRDMRGCRDLKQLMQVVKKDWPLHHFSSQHDANTAIELIRDRLLLNHSPKMFFHARRIANNCMKAELHDALDDESGDKIRTLITRGNIDCERITNELLTVMRRVFECYVPERRIGAPPEDLGRDGSAITFDTENGGLKWEHKDPSKPDLPNVHERDPEPTPRATNEELKTDTGETVYEPGRVTAEGGGDARDDGNNFMIKKLNGRFEITADVDCKGLHTLSKILAAVVILTKS